MMPRVAASLLLLATQRIDVSRRDETPLHYVADKHLQAMTLAVMYAFLKGRKAYKSGGEQAATAAVRGTLLQSLPSVLLKIVGDAGNATLGALRAAGDVEGHEFHGNQYTSGGSTELEVHHGSASSFDTFDASKAGSARDAGHLGKGVYFTTDQNAVSKDAFQYHAKVTLKNPLRIEVPDFKTDKRDVIRGALGLSKEKHTIGGSAERHSEEVTKALKDRGHDSVIVDYSKSGYHHQEVMVMHDHAINVIKRTARTLAAKTFRTLAPQHEGKPHNSIGPVHLAFNVKDPNAIKFAKERGAKLAKDISETTRDRIRDAVAGRLSGEDTDEDLLDAVGDEARADMIARTETMWAANEGQQEAWDQAIEAGLLPADATVEWIATSDACPICEDLDGKTRPVDGEYEDEEGGDGPPQHPNCRCTEGISAT